MESNSLFDDNAELLTSVNDLAGKILRHAAGQSNEAGIAAMQELEAVLSSAEILLKTADAVLVPENTRTNVTSYLNNIKGQLAVLVEEEEIDPTRLQTVSGYVDSLRMQLPLLLPRPNDVGVDLLRETVTKARQSASQHLRHLSTEIEEEMGALREDFATEKKEIKAKFDSSHQEVSETYERRITAFETEINEKQESIDEELAAAKSEVASLKSLSAETNETISSQKDRLDKAIAEFQKQFSERIGEFQQQFSSAEEERRKKLETSIESRDKAYRNETKERTEQLNAWQKEFTDQFEADKTRFDTNSNELIIQLRNYAQEAKVTLGLMSEKSLQNDFVLQADKEKARAWWWNLATFVNVLLLLAAIAYIFLHTFITPPTAESITYPAILSKFLVTAVIGVIARWTSRQANRHLAEERRLRRLALELATVNPFIQDLPDEVQHKVKEALAMRYYGNSNDEKAPFGEIAPVHEGDGGGIKSIPESIIDKIKGER